MKNLIQQEAGHKKSVKYLSNMTQEVGALFGYPLPTLPQGDEVDGGQKKIFIDFTPKLGALFRDFLQASHSLSTGQQTDAIVLEESFKQVQEILQKTAIQSILQERQTGLYNLFYLSLAKMCAGIVHEYFSSSGRKPYHKYLIHPRLSMLLSDIHQRAVRHVDLMEANSVSFRLGQAFNTSLIDCILMDQLPLVTTETEDIRVEDVLGVSNPRFQLSLVVYKEIYGILSSRLRKGIDRNDDRWLGQVQKTAGLSAGLDTKDVIKLLDHSDVVRFLLMDYNDVGKKIASSKSIKLKDVTYSELCSDYLDLMQALKRNELIKILKKNVVILSDRQVSRAEELYSTGSLYRFYEEGRIVNEARKVTTVFLDLRGFTKKSEEAISASELTDELYSIFDPMTLIVKKLHGKIDKFTGDGMMITFGVESRSAEDSLNALRMAIRAHDILRTLRKKEKTRFKMGISIHSGVAFVSNFIAGDDRVDKTVIGRNVNIAGRLSSAGDVDLLQREKREFDDLVGSLSRSLVNDEEKDCFMRTLDSRKMADKTVSGVSVDAQGNLYNLGIVLSQQTIQEVQQVVDLQSGEDGDVGYLYFHDPLLSRQISLYYVGDAKFKGVESAFPIYAVLL